ncbi:MAG: hypothetical protein JOZ51_16285 [Chloroflexi bacterium]|nr:hypothetical protein [Chloroflexota bacterium]
MQALLVLTLDNLHQSVKRRQSALWFTRVIRLLLAVGFLPSGLTKLLGDRFTSLSTTTPIGYFFEALYQTGYYWRFLGAAQLLAALLLLIPATSTLGALVYFPIILNIFIITVSLHFTGTPVITGLMLLASIYLLCWDYDKLKHLVLPVPNASRRSHSDAAYQDLHSGEQVV